jgi:hypothetical protein
MVRIDRTYSFKSLANTTSGENYKIMEDSIHSDHLPIWRMIWLEDEVKRKSPYIMYAVYFLETELKENIRRLWISQSTLPFFGKLQKCVKYYKMYCIREAL